MKKHTKIFISLITVIVLIVIFDFVSFKFANWKYLKDFVAEEEQSNFKMPSYMENRFRMHDVTTMYWFEHNGGEKLFRPAFGEEYKKTPIWIFGCSFVYGTSMVTGHHEEKDIFGSILSKRTQHPVYTRGYPSWGVQHMYYQLEKGDIFKQLPEPEYVIYVYIADHARRMQKLVYDFWSDGAYLRYEDKNGKLAQIKPILEPFWKLNAIKIWLIHLEYNIRLANDRHDKNFDLLKKYIISSNEILKKNNPKVKFIVLKYKGNDGFDSWFIETERWKEIEEAGITVIDADKELNINLKDKEYLDTDNYHPNPHAWEQISNLLAKKYIK